ncbi:hypothetical protein GCM10023082_35630 [Streptomyces tremellae]|uniref:Uncharacterized protein n=1 Tax=Streptomyces tremellae TaxID=1124239 RepID=A0ABP7FC62_9ACTN
MTTDPAWRAAVEGVPREVFLGDTVFRQVGAAREPAREPARRTAVGGGRVARIRPPRRDVGDPGRGR